MANLLHQLSKIRELRERRAQGVVRVERAVLAQAVHSRVTAANSLADFQEFSAARERALFAGLLNQEVKVRDIQDVRSAVSQMRLQEIGLAQGLERAQDAQVQQERVVQSVRVVHQKAQRAHQKVLEQIAMNEKADAVLTDRAEEAELAEVGRASDDAGVQQVAEGGCG